MRADVSLETNYLGDPVMSVEVDYNRNITIPFYIIVKST